MLSPLISFLYTVKPQSLHARPYSHTRQLPECFYTRPSQSLACAQVLRFPQTHSFYAFARPLGLFTTSLCGISRSELLI